MENIFIQQRQETIQHQVRAAHLEQYHWQQWWQKQWQKISHKTIHSTRVPLALVSADAACPCLF